MSDVLPKWTLGVPLRLAAAGSLTAMAVVAGCWYCLTPQYARVGYQPVQPVSFSHALHVSQVGVDCRYCHNGVEQSGVAGLPDTASCLNCHNLVLKEDSRLALVRESAATGKPIPWVRVHRLPDFVRFNHAAHSNRGVGCDECHGPVQTMTEVAHAQPLSMQFCLDCHRDPAASIRPVTEVCNLDWRRPADFTDKVARPLAREWQVQRLEHCSTCHQ